MARKTIESVGSKKVRTTQGRFFVLYLLHVSCTHPCIENFRQRHAKWRQQPQILDSGASNKDNSISFDGEIRRIRVQGCVFARHGLDFTAHAQSYFHWRDYDVYARYDPNVQY
jgi:hypothetical protein